jgi:hypothetical protein
MKKIAKKAKKSTNKFSNTGAPVRMYVMRDDGRLIESDVEVFGLSFLISADSRRVPIPSCASVMFDDGAELRSAEVDLPSGCVDGGDVRQIAGTCFLTPRYMKHLRVEAISMLDLRKAVRS